MGKRDYRWRELKKTKKEAKRVTAVEVLPSAVSVEVIKKKRKKREAEEE